MRALGRAKNERVGVMVEGSEQDLSIVVAIVVRTLGGALAILLASAVSYGVGYVLTTLSRRRTPRRDVMQQRWYRGPWSRLLRASPLGISLASSAVVFTVSLLLIYCISGSEFGWASFTASTVLLTGVIGLNWFVHFSMSGLLVKESGFQTVTELLEVARDQVKGVIEESGQEVGFDGVVRSNVMMYDSKRDVLEMVLWSGFDDPKKDIDVARILKSRKGVAGKAFWKRSKVLLGEIRKLDRPANGANDWHFTTQDWDETRQDLEWICSVPLRLASQEEPIGVLNLDSNCEVDQQLLIKIGELAKDMVIPFTVMCSNFRKP